MSGQFMELVSRPAIGLHQYEGVRLLVDATVHLSAVSHSDAKKEPTQLNIRNMPIGNLWINGEKQELLDVELENWNSGWKIIFTTEAGVLLVYELDNGYVIIAD